ncbi:potassium transporter TrkA [Actinorugispora endophytica]|uniref:TrkA domain protein n=1 Tax=Actinorugispora endophytica TaxID=1605990 RepID=A0A4V3D787_9ACTN|nr:potassium transporter TrkA [Actinorugispora endophytica]TDQ46887.1 TrkA domain protein [Actinorugispora endophytica]
MGHKVRIQELPGIGKRYDAEAGAPGQRVSVVVRGNGIRDLYVFTSDSPDPDAVLELTEEQALRIGAILSGTFFTS